MIIWLLMIFSVLSYSCNGSLVDQSTQSYEVAVFDGKALTNIKTEVDVMKKNYDALLKRVDNTCNNEKEIASLKGQIQQLEHKLENTTQTFSCEIEVLRNILDNKYSPLEIPGNHSNESGDELQCPLGWIRRVDFGACYFFSDTQKSWNDAQEQCRKDNGSLTDIFSEKENLWLTDKYIQNQTASKFWIGGKYDNGVYKWFTSDGKTKHMNYTRLTNGLPDQHPQRNRLVCAHLNDGGMHGGLLFVLRQ
ncbi:C-type lectin domain family 10 member A-like [Mytilus trossulus]|uniref:C-type lectin domain family 10 member A-like n=1 Tax=Mytilus trossulus TaxID=6551 RepID=UPI0030044350